MMKMPGCVTLKKQATRRTGAARRLKGGRWIRGRFESRKRCAVDRPTEICLLALRVLQGQAVCASFFRIVNQRTHRS